MNVNVRIEGTVEEISDVLRALPQTVSLYTTAVELVDGSTPTPTSTHSESPQAESKFVTVRFARRVLRRRRLSTPMRKFLETLYEAHPEWVSVPALQEATGYDSSQYAGLMGAFGRRVAHTKRYDPEAEFFEWDWDEDEEVWKCRLPDTVREALALEGIV